MADAPTSCHLTKKKMPVWPPGEDIKQEEGFWGFPLGHKAAAQEDESRRGGQEGTSGKLLVLTMLLTGCE